MDSHTSPEHFLASELSHRMTLSSLQRRHSSRSRQATGSRRSRHPARVYKSAKSDHPSPKSSPAGHYSSSRRLTSREGPVAPHYLDQPTYSASVQADQRPSSWHFEYSHDVPNDFYSHTAPTSYPRHGLSSYPPFSLPMLDTNSYASPPYDDQVYSSSSPLEPSSHYRMPSSHQVSTISARSSPVQPFGTMTFLMPQHSYPIDPMLSSAYPPLMLGCPPSDQHLAAATSLEEQEEEDDDDADDDHGPALVGMGIYDRSPISADHSSSLFAPHSGFAGKGLKLEESFTPADDEPESPEPSSSPVARAGQIDISPTDTVPELDFDSFDDESLRWPSFDVDRSRYDHVAPLPQEVLDGQYQPAQQQHYTHHQPAVFGDFGSAYCSNGTEFDVGDFSAKLGQFRAQEEHADTTTPYGYYYAGI